MNKRPKKQPTISYGDGWTYPAVEFICAGCNLTIKVAACTIATEYRCDCGHVTALPAGAGRLKP